MFPSLSGSYCTGTNNGAVTCPAGQYLTRCSVTVLEVSSSDAAGTRAEPEGDPADRNRELTVTQLLFCSFAQDRTGACSQHALSLQADDAAFSAAFHRKLDSDANAKLPLEQGRGRASRW
jgi:hypothetical protein